MIIKILLSISFILAIGIFYLFTQSQNVMEITREIEIKAPKNKVWAVVADISGWSDVTTAVNASSGTMALGEVLSITMRGHKEGEDGPTYAPEFTEFENGTSFRWRATMGAGIIFTNDKKIVLEETENGTKLIHSEFFNGMMLPLMKGTMQTGVPPILDEMNAGFKAASEG